MCVRNVCTVYDVYTQHTHKHSTHTSALPTPHSPCITHTYAAHTSHERWGAGVKTQKNVRGEIGGWGREPFNEPYAPSLSTIYDGA